MGPGTDTRKGKEGDAMATQIARDGFARAILMRERCHAGAECKWCGQPARWFYYWTKDSSNPQPRYGRVLDPFCSVSCYRPYNA